MADKNIHENSEARKAEALYDQELAPALMAVARKCEASGMSFVAYCEYAEGENGLTAAMNAKASAAFRIALYAAQAGGNVDSLIAALVKDGKENGHNSIYLTMLDKDGGPSL